MKHIIKILFFICFIQNINAQIGFIQVYDFGNPGFQITNTLNINDTVYLTGTCLRPDSLYWCAFMARLDTTGNILGINYYSVQDDDVISEANNDFIQTFDGGIAMVFYTFNKRIPILLKTDKQGNVVFKFTFNASATSSVYHRLVETETGYLIIGVTAIKPGDNDVIGIYCDKNGNKKWQKTFGENDLVDFCYSAVLLKGGSLLLASYNYKYEIIPKNYTIKDVNIVIDTLGNLISLWKGMEIDTINKECFGYKLHKNEDGSFIVSGARIKTLPFNKDNQFNTVFGILKRDNNFNVIWRKEYPDPGFGFDRLYDIKPTSDSGYIVVGKRICNLKDSNYNNEIAGWMIKLDQNGKELWTRLDTAIYFSPGSQTHDWSGVSVLSTGGIITAGSITLIYDDLPPEYSHTVGWVMKVDKCGCIVPGCNPKVETSSISQLQSVKLYPNPAADYVTIESDSKFDVELYDFNARKLFGVLNQQSGYKLEMKTLLPGSYVVRVKTNEHSIYNKVIIKK